MKLVQIILNMNHFYINLYKYLCINYILNCNKMKTKDII